MRATLIVGAFLALLTLATLVTLHGPWWAGALFFGAPGLVIRLALLFVTPEEAP